MSKARASQAVVFAHLDLWVKKGFPQVGALHSFDETSIGGDVDNRYGSYVVDENGSSDEDGGQAALTQDPGMYDHSPRNGAHPLHHGRCLSLHPMCFVPTASKQSWPWMPFCQA